jgi:SAM-dependent methyltransferase
VHRWTHSMSNLWESSVAHWARRVFSRSQFWLRCRDLLLRSGRGNVQVNREDLARRYLSGTGIEIGPMTRPMRIPPGVQVRYVDRHSRQDLLRLEGANLTREGLDPSLIPEIDVVDDADRLGTFADASLDFVIANHVVEHTEDPLATLGQMLRIIRPGGVLFLTLPDARHWFDARRPRTTVEHLILDHAEGPQRSRRQHYEEWARIIESVPEERVAARVAEFAGADARHHFHVWELPDFLRFVLAVPLPCEVVHAQSYLKEFAVILRRTRQEIGTEALRPAGR